MEGRRRGAIRAASWKRWYLGRRGWTVRMSPCSWGSARQAGALKGKICEREREREREGVHISADTGRVREEQLQPRGLSEGALKREQSWKWTG